jgi:hypothetical protein
MYPASHIAPGNLCISQPLYIATHCILPPMVSWQLLHPAIHCILPPTVSNQTLYSANHFVLQTIISRKPLYPITSRILPTIVSCQLRDAARTHEITARNWEHSVKTTVRSASTVPDSRCPCVFSSQQCGPNCGSATGRRAHLFHTLRRPVRSGTGRSGGAADRTGSPHLVCADR